MPKVFASRHPKCHFQSFFFTFRWCPIKLTKKKRHIPGKINETWGYCSNTCPHYYRETCGGSKINKIGRFKEEWDKDPVLEVCFLKDMKMSKRLK